MAFASEDNMCGPDSSIDVNILNKTSKKNVLIIMLEYANVFEHDKLMYDRVTVA